MSSNNKKRTRNDDEEQDNSKVNAESLLISKLKQQQQQQQEEDTDVMGNDEEEEEDDGLDSDDDYVDMNDDPNEELQVDFDVSVPNFEKDYFGVELFLKNYLNGEAYDFGKLTELILGDEEQDEPNPLTSVIKIPYDDEGASVEDQERQSIADSEKKENKKSTTSTATSDNMTDEDGVFDGPLEGEWDWSSDTYGVLSVLDYKKNKKLDCMKQIKNYVLSVTPEKQKTQVSEIFEEGKVGIIINERVINMPIEFGPTLHENLHQETHDECKKNGTWFKYFFILSKIYYQKNVADTTGQQKKTKMEPIFQKPEEAYYYNSAAVKFTFPLKSAYTYDSNAVGMEYNIERQGVAMFIEGKYEKIQKTLGKMKKDLVGAVHVQQ